MKLSRYTLKNIASAELTVPDASVFELPEKVLQFGTGVLLRGLPDYFIDKANRQGIFNGRIVVVKSTRQGDLSQFDRQDGMYTLCVRSSEGRKEEAENIIVSSISRVLDAKKEWDAVLECAHSQQMQFIISNTTEVGIELVHDNIRQHPPQSYPGKLLSFLYERFKAFGGSPHSGMVILATELIPNNGEKLESIVLELAHLNSLEDSFIDWLECCNFFCNTLVDRIVTAHGAGENQKGLEAFLGYEDPLLIVAEKHRLWAIEANEDVAQKLTFAQVDEGIVLQPDIQAYSDLKLRLLNGAHTFSGALSLLAGLETVSQSMQHPLMSAYIRQLMHDEIAPAIPSYIPRARVDAFTKRVLERFSNDAIRHAWRNICQHFSQKMKERNVPVLKQHYLHTAEVPQLMSLGFAAHILYMKCTKVDGNYVGEMQGKGYVVQDERTLFYAKAWAKGNPAQAVHTVLCDEAFWGINLSELPLFEETVIKHIDALLQGKVLQSIEQALQQAQTV